MPTLFGRSPAPPRKDKSASTLPSRWRDGHASGSGNQLDSPSPLKPNGRTSTFSVQSPTGVAGGFQAFDAGGRGSMGEFGAIQSNGAVSRTLPSTTAGPLTPPDSPIAAPLLPPKYTFLPTRVSSIAHSISSDSVHYGAEDVVGYRPYGFLGGVGAKVVLGVDDVGKVIKDVGRELARRCVTTPMLFSNQALDLNPTRTRALIQSYVESISGTSSRKADTWVQDLQFAREYELAWLFRWALSRITRIREGSRELCHGVLEWEAYEEWRGRERASDYPLDAFPYFSAIVPSSVFHQILTPLFSLLSKFAAYSHISGLTPHTLSSLFAPLLFDIPSSSSCMAAHTTFIRAASATEHMLLAYIRSSSNKGGLGLTDLPSRLKEWVAGYPSMVASDGDLARASPRRGARVLRCERASRTVRAYSKDLIVNAESWAADIGQQWDAWDRVILRGRRGETGRPKFSPGWRRKMAVKEMLPLPSSSSTSSELNRKISYGRAQKPGQSPPQHRRISRVEGEDEARWGSLAGKEWSMFEEGGFDSPSKSTEELRSKLQFDLTESAKQRIAQRRQTMDWTEFASSSGGFNRTDPLLDMSLTFSAPLSDSITDWPRERDEIAKRLHKAQKDAVPFNYDTTPRIGAAVSQDPGSRADGKGRVYLEEAFVDCWSDWMMGGGWADREELTFKEANWVLIEYKARPSRGDGVVDDDPLADPRTSDLYFLFEERVPVDYQMAVADPKQKKTFGLFSSKKKRGPSSTLPRSPRAAQFDHTDFDRMLVHRDRTKKLTLGSSSGPNAAIWHVTPDINTTLKTNLPKSPTQGQPLSPLRREAPRRRTRSGGRSDSIEDAKMHEGKMSFFSSIKKDRTLRGAKTDESMRDKYKKDKEKQRAKEVEFEIHSASGLSSPDDNKDGKKGRQGKPKDDDKWMDVLIANGARRMDRQDASAPNPKVKPIASGLPVSPHPPRQYSPQPQAVPADFDPNTAHADRASSETQDRGYGGIQDQSALYATHSPETSGSVDVHEAVTPEEGADLARFPSWKRKPVPPLDEAPEETQTAESADDHRHAPEAPELGPVVPPKSANRTSPNTPPKTTARTEILSPSPTRRNGRDTINNVVDIYNRDSVLSNSTGDFEPSSELGESPRKSSDCYDDHAIQLKPRSGVNGVGQGQKYDRDRLTPPEEGDGDDTEMKPPGVMFDLTPGREPSPARYKHGEPLSFVGEEEEGEY